MIRSVNVKNLSKSSIKKIRRMIRAVKAEPEFYDQDTYGTCEEGANICTTVCCAAGWAVWLEDPKTYNREMKRQIRAGSWGTDFNWPAAGLKALDLRVDEDESSDALFGSYDCWPSKFYDMYGKATTPKQRAKAFEARWEHFIATDGAE